MGSKGTFFLLPCFSKRGGLFFSIYFLAAMRYIHLLIAAACLPPTQAELPLCRRPGNADLPAEQLGLYDHPACKLPSISLKKTLWESTNLELEQARTQK